MKYSLYVFLVILVVSGCSGSEKTESNIEAGQPYQMGFTVLDKEATGISFKNTLTETDTFNFFKYEYIYNGGGVAVGDINNDGLDDIYFTGNQVEDKLYLNEGNLKFKDITKSAIGPKASEGWHTGVLMQDVNGDGWLDIYVSRSGLDAKPDLLGNLLFINNQDNTFSEESAKYGVDIKRPTTQSVFFDMDNDNDLDLYVMNHPYNLDNTGGERKSVQEVERLIKSGSPYSDVLLENIDGKYHDVTKKAGVSNHAFGLGIAVSDVNDDGYADLYVSNDYMAPDHLYINNGDGTFTDEIHQQMKHISNYSMGNDIADFNNDGFLDIMTVDMVSEDHVRSKKNMGGMSTKKFWDVVNAGYHYQYMFNCLQMNHGNESYSDIAQMSGVAKTDWSWAPLIVDFNNDGHKDLFISNGYRRDTRDNDYNNGDIPVDKPVKTFEDALNLMPSTKVQNYIYENNKDLTFSKRMENWGLTEAVNTNGAAYADLDNDGDLDLVLNNMEDESFIIRNDLQGKNYLKIKFSDINAEGVKVNLIAGGITQSQEFRTVRGYQSSVLHGLHFGLDTLNEVEQIEIIWPNSKKQTLKHIKANQTIEIAKKDASENLEIIETEKFFTKAEVFDFKHSEKFVNDFEREVLLPHKMSQLGPFISSGDVNGDKVQDIYISGSQSYPGTLFLSSGDSYKRHPGPWEKQSFREEQGSVFFDLENDGDLDLLVVSGSNEYDFNAESMRHQLYKNEGNGTIVNATEELPNMETSAQRVIAGDYDGDGDQDIFIGGRQTPGYYPFAPRSYLLENQNGKLIDVTQNSKDLMGPGLITDSKFVDFDNDNDLDLVISGEWMAPTFMRNDGGVFVNVTTSFGTSDDVGWWQSVASDDLNGDGKADFVFGNIGLNNKFHPGPKHPLEIYVHDFDKNGTYDIVLGKYQNGTCYPVRGKQCSSEQMPFVSKKFPTYGEFAVADLEKIYGKEELEKALHYTATEFGSIVLLSQENGNYKKQLLPNYVQIGPLNDIIIHDLNNDGYKDIIAAGNNYAAEVETVRYDGGVGAVLLGDGMGNFKSINPHKSGFFVNSDVKDLHFIDGMLVVAANNAKFQFFELY